MTTPGMDDALLDEIASSSALLGLLFLNKPDSCQVQSVVAELRHSGLEDWPFGQAADVAEAQRLLTDGAQNEDAVFADYQRLFVGPFALEAPPWGSVYLDYESVICGCSTAALKEWMRAKGLQVDLKNNEPEDHIGLMLMLLSWLAANRPALISEYLEQHLCTWGPHFCELMQDKAATSFYQGVALLTRITLQGVAQQLDVQVTEPKFYR